jgi:hypothetical protein
MNDPLVCRLPLVVGYRVRSYSSVFLVDYNGLAPLGEYSEAASWAPESGARCSWGN